MTKDDLKSIMGYEESTNTGNKSADGSSGAQKENTKSVSRIVFLGAAKVGKSSIIRRFLKGRFEEKYIPTVDDVYSAKFLVRNYLASVELMDTSGGYDFPVMIRLCISKADAFVIVFSNDSLESLETASRYLDQIRQEREDYAPIVSETSRPFSDTSLRSLSLLAASPPPLVVVCNKSDLSPAISKVNEGTIMEWLLKSGLKPSQFVYASAKTDDYILDIFKALWAQNEVSKAIKFSTWTKQRRGSVALVLPENVKSNNNNSSPTEKSGSPGYEISNKRSSFFRNSLKLRRRNSSRQRKTKSEFMRLDCNIS